jgi:hypothetical protein
MRLNPEAAGISRALRLLACILLFAGCAPAPLRPAEAPGPALSWTGPDEFSADYLWEARRDPVAYDRPVKLVRLVVRRGRAVRAVGIDVFGATLVDELVTADAQGSINTRFRQGAENVDGLLLTQTVRRLFFREAASRVRWLTSVAGEAGAPPAGLGVQIDGAAVDLKLAGATTGPQPDSDFIYPPAP